MDNSRTGEAEQLHRCVHAPSRALLNDRLSNTADEPQLQDNFLDPNVLWGRNSSNEGALKLVSSAVSITDVKAELPLPSSPPLPAITVPARRSPDNKAWATERDIVQRQWLTDRREADYQALLELRRTEMVYNTDRYVPPPDNRAPHSRFAPLPPRRRTFLPFMQLPQQVQTSILKLCLISAQPIKIDFTWLRTFINSHARMPSAVQTIKHQDMTYHLPMPWNKLVRHISDMKEDLKPFHSALAERASKTRKHKAPCYGLTTSLLRVSKSIHIDAARVFYGGNTFSFPWQTTAWMQLESFLATIGTLNVANLRSIRICVPFWHHGIQRDFLEGAVLDVTSPASRLAVMRPPALDRLLSAIKHSVSALSTAARLETLGFDLEDGRMMDIWSGRYHNQDILISTSDAEEYAMRKQKGVALLKNATQALLHKPTLSLHGHSTGTMSASELTSSRLPAVEREAEKYGWQIDCGLGLRRW